MLQTMISFLLSTFSLPSVTQEDQADLRQGPFPPVKSIKTNKRR